MISRNVYPQTRPGKWSVWVVLAVFLLLIVATVSTQSAQPFNTGTLFDNTWAAAASMTAFAAAIGAFFVGLYTILRNQERAASVFFTVLLGGLVVLFVLFQLFA